MGGYKLKGPSERPVPRQYSLSPVFLEILQFEPRVRGISRGDALVGSNAFRLKFGLAWRFAIATCIIPTIIDLSNSGALQVLRRCMCVRRYYKHKAQSFGSSLIKIFYLDCLSRASPKQLTHSSKRLVSLPNLTYWTRKELSPSLTPTSSFSTFTTCAALGPLLSSFKYDLRLSSEPCASPDTCKYLIREYFETLY